MNIYLNFSLLGWLFLSIIWSPLEYYADLWLSFILPIMYYFKYIIAYIYEWKNIVVPSSYFIGSVMHFQRWFDIYIYYTIGKQTLVKVATALDWNWYSRVFINYILTLKKISYITFWWHGLILLM